MKAKQLIFALCMCLVGGVLAAQSNAVIDETLAQASLAGGNGAYLILTAAGLVDESVSPAAAWDALLAQEWFRSRKSAQDSLTLGEYSYILMRAFGMKGGIMYTLLPSPRYASRELGYKGIIIKDAGAYRAVSGQEALSMLGLVLRSGRR